MLGFVMSYWRTDPFVIMECTSLSMIISLALRSAQPQINIVILGFFWLVLGRYIFSNHLFIIHMCLYLKEASYRKYILGYCFFDNLWWSLLISSFWYHWFSKCFWYSSIHSYHIHYCFLLIALVFIPVFHSFSAFYNLNWIFYMISCFLSS